MRLWEAFLCRWEVYRTAIKRNPQRILACAADRKLYSSEVLRTSTLNIAAIELYLCHNLW